MANAKNERNPERLSLLDDCIDKGLTADETLLFMSNRGYTLDKKIYYNRKGLLEKRTAKGMETKANAGRLGHPSHKKAKPKKPSLLARGEKLAAGQPRSRHMSADEAVDAVHDFVRSKLGPQIQGRDEYPQPPAEAFQNPWMQLALESELLRRDNQKLRAVVAALLP